MDLCLPLKDKTSTSTFRDVLFSADNSSVMCPHHKVHLKCNLKEEVVAWYQVCYGSPILIKLHK